MIRVLCIFALLMTTASPLTLAAEESSPVDDKMAKMKQIMAENSERRAEERGSKGASLVSGLTSWDNEKQNEESLSPASRMFQGLALCVGFFLVGIYFYRRFFPRSSGSGEQSAQNLTVVDRVPLTQATSLILVEVEGKRTLLSVGSEQVQVLRQVTGEDINSQSGEKVQLVRKDAQEECVKNTKLSA